jgi:hypothetical protein
MSCSRSQCFEPTAASELKPCNKDPGEGVAVKLRSYVRCSPTRPDAPHVYLDSAVLRCSLTWIGCDVAWSESRATSPESGHFRWLNWPREQTDGDFGRLLGVLQPNRAAVICSAPPTKPTFVQLCCRAVRRVSNRPTTAVVRRASHRPQSAGPKSGPTWKLITGETMLKSRICQLTLS